MPPFFSVLLLAALAWGAFAFGAVYDWCYTPLFWACAGIGALGLVAPGARYRRPIEWSVVAGLVVILAAALVQTIPLSPGTIVRISPATDAFLRTFNIAYVNAAASGYRHPMSIDPPGTWLGIAALGSLGLLLVGTARGLGRRSLGVLAGGLVLLGLLLALAGIVQSGLYGRDPSPTEKIYGFWKPIFQAYPFGPFVNRNHFAGWMLLALPVSIGYFFGLVSRAMRGVKPTLRDRVLWFSSSGASQVVLVGLAVIVMGVSLVLTLSRSGTSCFVLALAISAWFVMRHQTTGSRRKVLLVYIALVAALSLGWVGIDRILERFALASGNDFAQRVAAWKDAWNVFLNFPWFGTGLNTYGTATLVFQTFGRDTGHFVEAHNDYVQILAEGGLLLALPALLAILLLAREITRRFAEGNDDPTTYWLRVGATTGLVAIAFQEIVEFSLQIPGIAALFAVVAGIAIHRVPRSGNV
ncbi:MAG TPA: O-antigen ligase family protein [Vicinamibacterales bacterium]